MFNFATASVNKTDLDARLEDIQKDALRILQDGGVMAFNAKTEWRGEAAALVRQSVQDIFAMTDPTPIFTERREGVYGDTYEFEELVNTLRVVEYAPNSLPQIFTPRKGKYTIKTAMYELPYGIDLTKILSGQHTVASFAQMAAEAAVRFMTNFTLTGIDKACAVGTTDLKGRALRTTAGGADVSKPEIDGALRRMNAFNSGVTIFGSRYALDAIYNHGATASGDDVKDELNARGVIGRYRGARLVEMVDDHNMFTNAFSKVNGVDLDKLIFLAAGSPGAVLLDKDVSQLDWETLDVRKAIWASGMRMDIGMLVTKPWRYHVVQLA
jgi:hypothetical protein